jgi:hypothetical protein
MIKQCRIFSEKMSRLMSFWQGVLRVSILAIGVFVSAIQCTATSYYVDYSSGADTSSGTDTSSAWQHCPGDPAATGVAANTALNPGDTVFFKGGVRYMLSPQNASDVSANQGGIVLKWNGAAGNPITYTSTSAWGAGRAIFTDGYSANWICAFYAPGTVNDLVFNNLELGPIGGSASLPPDTGSAVPPKPGAGILAGGSLINVTIANCYFHQLGYWFNQQPMGDGSIYGEGIQCIDYVGLTITNCEFTMMGIACELPISNVSSNLTIANCNFHDAIIWCIDLSHDQNGCSLDSVYIVGNTFDNYCQQWNNWTGYGGWPHADGIFVRGDNLTTFNDGPNINVYNNTFFDSQPGASTGAITLEGGVSVNIYNNLFSTVNSVPINPWNTNFLVRIYNNTFYEVNNTHLYPSAYPYYTWRTAASTQLDVKNNIFYDTAASVSILSFNITNTAAAYPKFSFDYNCYRSLAKGFVYQTLSSTSASNTDLGGLQGHGWEAHGMATDPLFDSLAGGTANSIANIYGLQAGSPCIGAGANLSGLNLPGLNADKAGTPRPASGPWDLGAYEYNTNSVPTNNIPTNSVPTPAGQPPSPGGSDPASVTLAFSDVVQTCKTRTKINHATTTTDSVTMCKVKFSLIARNAGTAKSSSFPIMLWPGQSSVFDPTMSPWPVKKRVKALAQSKSASIKLTGKFTGNQAGTFIYVTDTNYNVLASATVPDSQ